MSSEPEDTYVRQIAAEAVKAEAIGFAQYLGNIEEHKATLGSVRDSLDRYKPLLAKSLQDLDILWTMYKKEKNDNNTTPELGPSEGQGR